MYVHVTQKTKPLRIAGIIDDYRSRFSSSETVQNQYLWLPYAPFHYSSINLQSIRIDARRTDITSRHPSRSSFSFHTSGPGLVPFGTVPNTRLLELSALKEDSGDCDVFPV
jgi:hypothetical protein